MIPLIDQHRAELTRLCRKHGVIRLELFGSAARDLLGALTARNTRY